MWGKLANAGQTCIAPDYVMCSESVRDRFVDSCKKAAEQFFGKVDRNIESTHNFLHSHI